MSPKIFLPQVSFPTHVTVVVPLPDMLNHVVLQMRLAKELVTAHCTLHVLFLIVRASYVIVHEGVPSEYLVAKRAFVSDVVRLHQVPQPVVYCLEALAAVRAFVRLSPVRLILVSFQFHSVFEGLPASAFKILQLVVARHVRTVVGLTPERLAAVHANDIVVCVNLVHVGEELTKISKRLLTDRTDHIVLY